MSLQMTPLTEQAKREDHGIDSEMSQPKTMHNQGVASLQTTPLTGQACRKDHSIVPEMSHPETMQYQGVVSLQMTPLTEHANVVQGNGTDKPCGKDSADQRVNGISSTGDFAISQGITKGSTDIENYYGDNPAFLVSQVLEKVDGSEHTPKCSTRENMPDPAKVSAQERMPDAPNFIANMTTPQAVQNENGNKDISGCIMSSKLVRNEEEFSNNGKVCDTQVSTAVQTDSSYFLVSSISIGTQTDFKEMKESCTSPMVFSSEIQTDSDACRADCSNVVNSAGQCNIDTSAVLVRDVSANSAGQCNIDNTAVLVKDVIDNTGDHSSVVSIELDKADPNVSVTVTNKDENQEYARLDISQDSFYSASEGISACSNDVMENVNITCEDEMGKNSYSLRSKSK